MGRSNNRNRAAFKGATSLTLFLWAATSLVSCREGEGEQAAGFIPILVSTAGNHGCAGPNQASTATATLDGVDLGGFVTDSFSRMAAAADSPLLFISGAGAQVLELDVTDPAAPVAVPLVGAGVVDALIASAGVSLPAQLSGIAVMDAGFLVAIEHTSNTLILIDRLIPDEVSILAGLPSSSGGFADGAGGSIRFSFSAPTSLVPAGDGRLYVADSGNHAIRRLQIGALPQAETVAGSGAPGFQDGSLGTALFDTPTGLSVSCDGRLLVTETGAAGLGGQRLRSLSIGSPDFFGNLSGDVTTLAGSGIAASTEGVGAAADLAAPGDVFSTLAGEVYFVDGLTGYPLRYSMDSGLVDCAFGALSCANPTGVFDGDSNVALTASSSGDFYFLRGTSGVLELYREN